MQTLLESTKSSDDIGESLDYLLLNGADVMLPYRDGSDGDRVLPIHVAIKTQCENVRENAIKTQSKATYKSDLLPQKDV